MMVIGKCEVEEDVNIAVKTDSSLHNIIVLSRTGHVSLISLSLNRLRPPAFPLLTPIGLDFPPLQRIFVPQPFRHIFRIL